LEKNGKSFIGVMMLDFNRYLCDMSIGIRPEQNFEEVHLGSAELSSRVIEYWILRPFFLKVYGRVVCLLSVGALLVF